MIKASIVFAWVEEQKTTSACSKFGNEYTVPNYYDVLIYRLFEWLQVERLRTQLHVFSIKIQ